MTGTWPLRTRFVLLALICLLPVLGVVSYIVYQTIEYNRDQLTASETFISDTVAQGIDSTLEDNTSVLQVMAQTSPVQALTGITNGNGAINSAAANQSRTATVQLFDYAQTFRRNLNTLFLTGANGQITVWKGSLHQPDFQQTIAEVVTRTSQTANPSISGAITSTSDGTSFVVLTYPIFSANQSSGQVIGVLGGILSVDRLRQTFTPFARGNTLIMVVYNGQIITTSAPEAERTPMLNAATGAQRSASQTFTYTGAGDQKRQATLSSVEVGSSAPWTVVVSDPAVYGPNQTVLLRGLAGAAIAVVIAMLAATVLAERTTRPIRELTRQATALANGDLSARDARVTNFDGVSETRELGHAMQQMAQRMTAQVDELAASTQLREQQAGQLRDLNRRNIRAQEEERRRLAGEIHDAVSPLITGALYQSRAMLLNDPDGNDAQKAGLNDISDLLTSASDELHGVIFDLRPPDLDDLGVVAAIERYIQNFSRGGMGTTNISVVGQEPPGLTPEIRVTVYRIVQEALHNVVRHAGADEAVVALETLDNQFQVMIRDNGAGFDPEQARRPTSLGLLSMRERAASIGAALHIESTPGLGTAVILDRRMAPQSSPARRTQRRSRIVRPEPVRRATANHDGQDDQEPPQDNGAGGETGDAAASPTLTIARSVSVRLRERLSELAAPWSR